MPSERHINRQIQWRDTLRKYGATVSLERTVHIRRARVVVDVYAEIEGKVFLIEIGDVDDDRKKALMQYYAQDKPNVEFVHEPYGYNEIQHVLNNIQAYRSSVEYQHYKRIQDLKAQIKAKKQKDAENVIKTAILIFFASIFLGIVFVSINPQDSTTSTLGAMFTVLLFFASLFLGFIGVAMKPSSF